MKTLSLSYNIAEGFNPRLVNTDLQNSNANTVFQWDFQNSLKEQALKEIRTAIKSFKKNGTIDY